MKFYKLLSAVTISVLLGFAPLCQAAQEKPVSITAEQIEKAVKNAPQCPAIDGMDLSLKLIDYIDCTDTQDPHDFMDQGTSKIQSSKKELLYRRTALHRHAFFAYRFKSAGKDKPVLIVFEYPDDDERLINFSTHESVLSGRRNIDWSLETGVYTGNPFPNTKQMQYHSFVFWAQDNYPAAIVSNFHRGGKAAAASKIWVYAINDRLPPLKTDGEFAKESQRQLGHFNSMGWYLPTRLYFGANSPRAIDHMVQYCKYVGVNELAWTVVSGNGYGFDCTIPSWTDKPGHPTHLDTVLQTLDSRGNMSFAAGFNMAESFELTGGKNLGDLSSEQLREVMLAGFGEFLDRYGKFKSLKKIIIGAQYNISLADHLNKHGVLADVVSFIKLRRPDIQVMTFIGGRQLHEQYFSGQHETSTPAEVIEGWEDSDDSFGDYLAVEAAKCWDLWGHNPAKLSEIDGLIIYNQYQSDDFGIYPLYGQQPRSMIYHDLDRSKKRSDFIDSDFAAIWNTHYEGWFGLHEDVNFWYKKLWVAPDFNAAGDFARAAFVRTLAHRDRLAIMPGSWNFKYFGHEKAMRRFAKAYRSLPPVIMEDVKVSGSDSVKVRWAFYEKNRYVAIINQSPFADSVHIDGKLIELEPFDLVTVINEAKLDAPKAQGGKNIQYANWVNAKKDKFASLLGEYKKFCSNTQAKPYARVLEKAAQLIEDEKILAADLELADGLINELQLRIDISNPPQMAVPHKNDVLYAGVRFVTPVDAQAALAGHLFYPLSWAGPKDLSAGWIMEHDNTNLRIILYIKDKDHSKKDSVALKFSTNGAYLDYKSESRSMNFVWTVNAPHPDHSVEANQANGIKYTAKSTDSGYNLDISIPLSLLKVKPGGSVGFLMQITDDDNLPNTFNAGWAAKQAILIPHKPNFAYWYDARNCGKLIIKPKKK